MKKRYRCEVKVCMLCKCFCGGIDICNFYEEMKCEDCGCGFFNKWCYDFYKCFYCVVKDNCFICLLVYVCFICRRDLKIVKGVRINKNYWNGKLYECYKIYCNICKINVDKFDYFCFFCFFKF